jgi:hypothetical protein
MSANRQDSGPQNPYESPPPQNAPGKSQSQTIASVQWPAIGLIAVSVLMLALMLLAIPYDIYLLSSGKIDDVGVGASGIDSRTQTVVRITWGLLLLVSNILVLTGAIKMMYFKSLGWARLGAILAVIPCIGPGYFLGIPFGIWALVILGRPEVYNMFPKK